MIKIKFLAGELYLQSLFQSAQHLSEKGRIRSRIRIRIRNCDKRILEAQKHVMYWSF
jgi:hypothetical protein